MKRLDIKAAARRDLIEIEEYSVEEFGYTVAQSYLLAIRGAFERILEHPRIGAVYPGVKPKMHALGAGSHRIFYRLTRDEVVIVRILHKARDVDRLL